MFQIPYNIKALVPLSNLDSRYGPYNDIPEALTSVITALRAVGLTIGIIEGGDVVEYWFKSGIDDNDLVLKTADAGGGSSYIPPIYITNIEASTGYNIIVEKDIAPNEEIVVSYSSNNNVVDITFEWDRDGSSYHGEPEVWDEEGSAGYKSIWDLPSSFTEKNGGTTTRTVTVTLPSIGSPILYKYKDPTPYSIPGSSLTPPVIQDIRFGVLPLLSTAYGFDGTTQRQTALKAADKITVTVDSDKPIRKVEILPYGISGSPQTFSFTAPYQTTVDCIDVVVRSLPPAATAQYDVQVKVYDADLTESISVISTNKVSYNNTVLSYNPTITYNLGAAIAGFTPTATKFGDTVSLTFGSLAINAKTLVINKTGTNFFTITKSGEGSYSLALTTDDLTYSYNTDNISYSVYNTTNGAISIGGNIKINIDNTVPNIVAPSLEVISFVSGIQDIPITFNSNRFAQVLSQSANSTGVILNAPSTAFATSYTIQVSSVPGTVNFYESPQSLTITLRSRAGKDSGNISIPIALKGFAQDGTTFIRENPAVPLRYVLPINVVSTSNLVITATINGTNPFVIDITDATLIGDGDAFGTGSGDINKFKILDTATVSPTLIGLNGKTTNNVIELSSALNGFDGFNTPGNTITLLVKEEY